MTNKLLIFINLNYLFMAKINNGLQIEYITYNRR
ncbi:MAG: hypothetical protein ACJA1K_000250 [Cognaticolwellia sp.]|jgi:hypothetical protein